MSTTAIIILAGLAAFVGAQLVIILVCQSHDAAWQARQTEAS